MFVPWPDELFAACVMVPRRFGAEQRPSRSDCTLRYSNQWQPRHLQMSIEISHLQPITRWLARPRVQFPVCARHLKIARSHSGPSAQVPTAPYRPYLRCIKVKQSVGQGRNLAGSSNLIRQIHRPLHRMAQANPPAVLSHLNPPPDTPHVPWWHS